MLTQLNATSKYLSSIGRLYKAFSIHKKSSIYENQSLDQAIELVHLTNTYLNNSVAQIRSHCNDLPATLNWPDGSISDKTFLSSQLEEWGLRQLKSTLDSCQYKGLKMKTYNTLNIEHLHSNVHFKESSLTPLDYARAFANTVTENIKRLTESGFYYHTSSDSWYPPPAQTLFSLPKLKKSKQTNIKPEEA